MFKKKPVITMDYTNDNLLYLWNHGIYWFKSKGEFEYFRDKTCIVRLKKVSDGSSAN